MRRRKHRGRLDCVRCTRAATAGRCCRGPRIGGRTPGFGAPRVRFAVNADTRSPLGRNQAPAARHYANPSSSCCRNNRERAAGADASEQSGKRHRHRRWNLRSATDSGSARRRGRRGRPCFRIQIEQRQCRQRECWLPPWTICVCLEVASAGLSNHDRSSSAPVVSPRPSRACAAPGGAAADRQVAATTGGCLVGTTRGLTWVATPARCEPRPRAHLPSVNSCAPPGPTVPPIRANEESDRQQGNTFAHRRAGLGKVSRDRRLPERDGRCDRGPAARRRLAREPVAGDRRDHDVKRVGRAAAVCRRFRQRAEDLEHLDHRARPAVRKDHRRGKDYTSSSTARSSSQLSTSSGTRPGTGTPATSPARRSISFQTPVVAVQSGQIGEGARRGLWTRAGKNQVSAPSARSVSHLAKAGHSALADSLQTIGWKRK